MSEKKITIARIRKFIKTKPEKTFHQFLRYLVAGGMATGVDLSVLFVLYQLLHINYLVAAAISYACGILTNFTVNVLFVFESTGRIKKEFIIFVSVGAIGLLWTELILWTLSDKLHIPVMLAKLVAILFVLNWNFFMRKKLVFGK
ncbi:MAG: GtrA family protein [Candidatus Moraniibacteriota bacterium]